MNEKQLHALPAEFAKNLKTPEDLNQFSRMLKKITVEAALDASKKWTMPIQNRKPAMNRFMIDFGDRLDDHR